MEARIQLLSMGACGILFVISAGCAAVSLDADDARASASGAGGGRPDASVDRVVGGPPLGDAACATQTLKAELLPLDIYVMLDSSESMSELTEVGTSKWDAIRAALMSFLGDPASAGLGVGLQYFPLTKVEVPARCAVSADCRGAGLCNFLRGCLAAGTPCNTGADCPRGDRCELVGQCRVTGQLCLPAGADCGGTTGNQCAPIDGYCEDRDLCESAPYAAPAVEIAPLPAAAAGLVASLVQHVPDGLTPTSGALAGAIAHAQALAQATLDRRVVVLLATDGLPSECAPSDIAGVSAIAAQGFAGSPSISTFVIGVFAPDEQLDAQANLDAIAAAGGTKKAFVINVTQNVTQAFGAALDAVRTAALACEFKVPTAPAGQTVDFTRVNVQYTSSTGQAATIGNVRDRATCDPRKGGWYYDADPRTGGTPRTISTCDATCTQLRADAAGRVDVLLGCQTEYIIP